MKGHPNNFSNEDCVAVVSKKSQWNDIPCAFKAQFICEKRIDPAIEAIKLQALIEG
jgi:hypothetical protein